MTVDAFLGLSDDPAELDGHGPMPAAYGRWMRKSLQSLAVVVVNARGHAVGVGGTVYPPRQQVTDQVITAAGTCRFPSCRIPAANCDLDHRVPFDHLHPERGGPTDPTNLDPACENHHLLKTFTGWTPQRDTTDGASMRWTSPTGHTYLDPAKEHTLPDDDRDALTSPPDGEDPDTADPNRDDDYDLDDWTILPSHLDQSTAQIQAQAALQPTLTELESKRANDIWEKFHFHVIRPPQTCGRVGWLQDPSGDPGHSDAKNPWAV